MLSPKKLKNFAMDWITKTYLGGFEQSIFNLRNESLTTKPLAVELCSSFKHVWILLLATYSLK